ncbi:hypothetical protein F4809DRAFT_543937 [Biscogniauxia mediterranea]|nr:hypothetical protein F4809DRAFT_543937 [Biscogniauxia mediterranea]
MLPALSLCVCVCAFNLSSLPILSGIRGASRNILPSFLPFSLSFFLSLLLKHPPILKSFISPLPLSLPPSVLILLPFSFFINSPHLKPPPPPPKKKTPQTNTKSKGEKRKIERKWVFWSSSCV